MSIFHVVLETARFLASLLDFLAPPDFFGAARFLAPLVLHAPSMDPIANKRLLCDALQAQRFAEADMTQAPVLMLARLMGDRSAVHWAEKKPNNKPTWKSFQHKERSRLGDVNGVADEVERRWLSLKAVVLKPTDLEVAHDNSDEFRNDITSAGWKCILEDKTTSWYRKQKETTDESPEDTAAKSAHKRMKTATTTTVSDQVESSDNNTPSAVQTAPAVEFDGEATEEVDEEKVSSSSFPTDVRPDSAMVSQLTGEEKATETTKGAATEEAPAEEAVTEGKASTKETEEGESHAEKEKEKSHKETKAHEEAAQEQGEEKPTQEVTDKDDGVKEQDV